MRSWRLLAADVWEADAGTASATVGRACWPHCPERDCIGQAVVIFGQAVIVKFNGTMIVRSVSPVIAASIDALPSDPEALVQMFSHVSDGSMAASGGRPSRRLVG